MTYGYCAQVELQFRPKLTTVHTQVVHDSKEWDCYPRFSSAFSVRL